jgi:protein TorT
VRKDSEGKDITVAFFPGPKGSGWAPDTLLGFQQAFEGSKGAKGKLKLLPAQYGDTGYKMQRNLISYILKRYKRIDYLVGNAVAADAAVDVLKEYRADHPTAKIVSTYIIPDVYEKISQGKIAAAPTDLTVDQGRMSVDMMIRILNGEKPGDKASKFPFRSGPVIQVVTLKNLADFTYGRLFGPKGFSPIFKYEP